MSYPRSHKYFNTLKASSRTEGRQPNHILICCPHGLGGLNATQKLHESESNPDGGSELCNRNRGFEYRVCPAIEWTNHVLDPQGRQFTQNRVSVSEFSNLLQERAQNQKSLASMVARETIRRSLIVFYLLESVYSRSKLGGCIHRLFVDHTTVAMCDGWNWSGDALHPHSDPTQTYPRIVKSFNG